MSRSYRKPAYYATCGVNSVVGKQVISRALRRKANMQCHEVYLRMMGEGWPEETLEVYLDHPQDRVRGKAGSRSPGWGWDYFGEGRRVIRPGKVKPREHLPDVYWDTYMDTRRPVNISNRPTYTTRELANLISRK